MLILTRKIGESIRVEDNISIAVLDIKGNQVRLGVEAPKHIAVHREEIYQSLKGKNAKG